MNRKFKSKDDWNVYKSYECIKHSHGTLTFMKTEKYTVQLSKHRTDLRSTFLNVSI